MSVTVSHRFLVWVLRLMGGRKFLDKKLAKGLSATVVPKEKDRTTYNIGKSEFKNQLIWSYAGNNTLIYYLHGGGFVLGFFPLYFPMIGKIAKLSGATVVAPDYPLPPKASALETHEWMREHYLNTVEKHAPKRVIIMGDSAGGNLAIGLASWLGAAGHKKAEKLVVLAPWVDLEMARPDGKLDPGELFIIPDDLRMAGKRYAGDMDIKDPLISPLFAENLDLPETHIFTGDQDPLHPDIMKFAAKYPQAKIDLGKNLPHVYMLMPTSEAKAAFVRVADIVKD